jgi:hypothetical protein
VTNVSIQWELRNRHAEGYFPYIWSFTTGLPYLWGKYLFATMVLFTAIKETKALLICEK